MGFSAQDFPKILEYGGKEFLDMEYKDYECIPDLEINKTKFNLGIKISLAKYKKAFEKKPKGLSEEEEEKIHRRKKSYKKRIRRIRKSNSRKIK